MSLRDNTASRLLVNQLREQGVDAPDAPEEGFDQEQFAALDAVHVEAVKRNNALAHQIRREQSAIAEENEQAEQGRLRQLLVTAQQPEDTPNDIRDSFDLAGPAATMSELDDVAYRDRTSQFGQGLRSAGQQLAAIPAGVESIARGLAGDEEGATRAATRAGERLNRAAELAPQNSLQGVVEGGNEFGDWLAGALGQQVPILATFIGTGGIGGLAGRAAQKGVERGIARTVAQQTAARDVRREALDRAIQAHAQARTRSTAGAVGGNTTQFRAADRLVQESNELLRQTIARGPLREGVYSAVAAGGTGVALYSPDTSQFLIDPDAEGTVQEKAAVALTGASIASLASIVPTLAVLRNVGLGTTAARMQQMGAQSALRRLPTEGARQAVYEGSAEVAAEAGKTWAHSWINDNIDVFSSEQIAKYIEAGAVGALLGGGLGTATSVRSGDFKELGSYMMRFREPGPQQQAMMDRATANEQARSREKAAPERRILEGEYERLDEIRAQMSFEEFSTRAKFDRGETLALGNLVEGVDSFEAGTLLRVLVDPTMEEMAARALPTEEGQPAASFGNAAYERLAAQIGEENMATTISAARDMLFASTITQKRLNQRLAEDPNTTPEKAALYRSLVDEANARIRAMEDDGNLPRISENDQEASSEDLIGTQDAPVRVSFPFAESDAAAGPQGRTATNQGLFRIPEVGSIWAADSQTASQKATEIQQTMAGSEGRAQAVPLGDTLTEVVSDEQLIQTATDLAARDRNTFRTDVFNRAEGEPLIRAREYLNKFETVRVEQEAAGLSGVDQRVFSPREVESFIVPQDQNATTGVVEATRSGPGFEGRPVRVDVIRATQQMMGRLDDLEATGEGGTGTRLRNIGRALNSAVAALREQGIAFELAPETVVFRRAGGEEITAGAAQAATQQRAQEAARAGAASTADLRRELASIEEQLAQPGNSERRAALQANKKRVEARLEQRRKKYKKLVATATARAKALEDSISDFEAVRFQKGRGDIIRENRKAMARARSRLKEARQSRDQDQIDQATTELGALELMDRLLTAEFNRADTQLAKARQRIQKARDALMAHQLLRALDYLTVRSLWAGDPHRNALVQFFRDEEQKLNDVGSDGNFDVPEGPFGDMISPDFTGTLKERLQDRIDEAKDVLAEATPKQREGLQEEIELLEAAARISETSAVQRRNETEYANEIIKNLKLEQVEIGRILTTTEAADRVQGRGINLADHDGLSFTTMDADGNITTDIWINEGITDRAERIGVLHHEIGHAVVTSAGFKLSNADAEAVLGAYNEWRKTNKEGRVGSAIKSKRSLLNMLAVRSDDFRMIADLSDAERANLLDFQEWFADNVSRWIETDKRPQGIIAKFFHNIAQKLKTLLRLNRKAGYADASVATVLNRMWDSKAPNGHVRKFSLWKGMEGDAALSKVKNVDGLFEEVRAQFDGDIPSDRIITGGVQAATNPGSIEAFYGTRDYVVGKMSKAERRVIGRALVRPKAQRQLKEAYSRAADMGQPIPTDAHSQIALAYMLWSAGALDLTPKQAAPLRAATKWFHEVTGLVHQNDQALQVLQAMQQDVFGARENTLQKAAPKESHLGKGAYVLESAQLRHLAKLEATGRLGDAETNPDQVDRIVDDLPTYLFPTRIKAKLAADIKDGVLTEALLNQFKNESDFVLNPDKQFAIQQFVGTTGAQNAANAVYQHLTAFKDYLRNSLLGKGVLGEAMRARGSQNAAVLAFQEALYTDVAQEGGREGYVDAKDRATGAAQAEWEAIWSDLTVEQQKAFREAFLGREAPTDPAVKRAITRTNRFMRRQHKYAQEVGLLKNSRFDENYRPWSFDAGRVDRHANKILETWSHKRYRKHWWKLYKEHQPEAAGDKKDFDSDDQYESYVQAYVASIALENGFVDAARPEEGQIGTLPYAQNLNRRELAFLDDAKIAPPADRKLLASLFDDSINTTMAKYIGQMTKRVEYVRRFGANDEKLNQMMAQAREQGASKADIALMENMIRSATGRIGLEVSAFWKKVAQPFNSILEPIRQEDGSPFETREAAMRAQKKEGVQGEVVKTDSGWEVKRDVTADPRRFRQNMSWVVVYQNWTILAFAALTNVADLAGIAFRTGDLPVAFEAYKEGVGRVMRQVRDRRQDDATRKANTDSAERLAVELGVVAHASISEHLGLQYGSVHMTGTAKRWNDIFFQLNGMEFLTRHTRIMAVTAGRSFLAKHAAGAARNDPKSLEALAELGLDPADLRLTENGELDLLSAADIVEALEGTEFGSAQGAAEAVARGEEVGVAAQELARDERVKRALSRMVNESVLRPASWQRATWMNDPNWQIFSHLKGFMYTYHERVLRRIMSKSVAGSLGPLVMASSYVATMMAADLLRELIQHGPEGDDRKEEWGFRERLADGIHRSGLMGLYTVVPDMMKTHEFGKSQIAQMGGPTTGWLEQWYRTIFGQGSAASAVQRSLPAGQVLTPLENWGAWTVDPRIGEPDSGSMDVPLIRPEISEALSSN